MEALVGHEVHGDGEPLLLISGLGGLGAYWRPNLPALAARHRVILHDHAGLGRSAHLPARTTVGDMAQDLRHLMDHLGLAKAHLLGHSLGSLVAQSFALDHSDRVGTLSLAASWPHADAYLRRYFESRKAMAVHAGPLAYLRSNPLALYPPSWIRDHAEALDAREPLQLAAYPGAAVMAARLDALLAFDRREELAALRMPVLLLGALDDPIALPEFSRDLAQRLGHAELHLLPDGGHCASETRPEAFEAEVLRFLRAHPLHQEAGPALRPALHG